MKTKITFALVLTIVSLSLLAQDFERPKKGAKLYVQDNTIEVSENGATTFDLWLVKSRLAKKVDFETPKAIHPDGTVFTFEKHPQNPDQYSVSVKAEDIETGDHSVTIMGRRSGMHSVTGTIITLRVNPAKSVASSDGN